MKTTVNMDLSMRADSQFEVRGIEASERFEDDMVEHNACSGPLMDILAGCCQANLGDN